MGDAESEKGITRRNWWVIAITATAAGAYVAYTTLSGRSTRSRGRYPTGNVRRKPPRYVTVDLPDPDHVISIDHVGDYASKPHNRDLIAQWKSDPYSFPHLFPPLPPGLTIAPACTIVNIGDGKVVGILDRPETVDNNGDPVFDGNIDVYVYKQQGEDEHVLFETDMAMQLMRPDGTRVMGPECRRLLSDYTGSLRVIRGPGVLLVEEADEIRGVQINLASSFPDYPLLDHGILSVPAFC